MANELDLALTRASVSEARETDLTWKVGVYKNALTEIQRRINKPSPAILFEIDEIIKKAFGAQGPDMTKLRTTREA